MGDANVDALGASNSDQLGHLNIIIIFMQMTNMMIKAMTAITMLTMIAAMTVKTGMTVLTVVTHGIEKSEAGVCQVVNQDHLNQNHDQNQGKKQNMEQNQN